MYFIYGQENYLITNEVKKIIKKKQVAPLVFDETSSVSEIITELTTISLFGESKLIWIKNHPVFSDNNKAELVCRALKAIDKDTILIMSYFTDNIKITNPLVKIMTSSWITKKFDRVKQKQIVPTIKDIVKSKGATISNKAAIQFAQIVPNDLRIIIMEIDKLIAESKDITDSMIEISISKYQSEDYFALTNALAMGNPIDIVDAYNKRKSSGDEVMLMVGQISSVLILANKIFYLKKLEYTLLMISKELGIHIFRIKKTNDVLSKAGYRKIKELICKLSKLDYEIKKGKVDPNIGLDSFILKLIK